MSNAVNHSIESRKVVGRSCGLINQLLDLNETPENSTVAPHYGREIVMHLQQVLFTLDMVLGTSAPIIKIPANATPSFPVVFSDRLRRDLIFVHGALHDPLLFSNSSASIPAVDTLRRARNLVDKHIKEIWRP